MLCLCITFFLTFRDPSRFRRLPKVQHTADISSHNYRCNPNNSHTFCGCFVETIFTLYKEFKVPKSSDVDNDGCCYAFSRFL
jgi:hypothetical protein